MQLQSVSNDTEKQLVNQQLLQQAKVLAEAFENFRDRFGGRGHPTMSTVTMLAKSERLNDPANLPYLPTNLNAMRHIALMQDPTFEQYCEKTKEKAQPLTLREIKALREKLEPTEEQKRYKEWRERCQGYQAEERQQVREEIAPTYEEDTERQKEYVPDIEDCSRPLTLSIAVGDCTEYWAKFKLGIRF